MSENQVDISKEHISHMLKTNNLWLVRGILAIYRNQTLDEQNNSCTMHSNGVGFNGVDAGFLSSLAIQILNKVENGCPYQYALSKSQLNVARKMMIKYSGQLHRIAERNISDAA